MPDAPDCTIIIPEHKLPGVGSAPPIALRLHAQCLSAKSVLLRGLLSGVSPVDLSASLPFRISRSHLPRLLPSPPSHPVLFLPVPDPSSIQQLFQWIYSDNTDHIETALDQGLIRWEGLARNVEYLCLSTDIKVFLGRWYRNWHLPARCFSRRTPCLDDDESDLDSDDDPATPPTEVEECDRGRTRDVKLLEQLCGKLHLCTA